MPIGKWKAIRTVPAFTNHPARRGRPPDVIRLLIQAGERPREKALVRGRMVTRL
jgi:hypothetical protein